MRVVLRADVEGLGRKGDIFNVANGYARNFLLPKGLAFKASPGVEKQAEAMRQAAIMAKAASLADAEAVAVKLAPTILEVSAKATESGHLYGSVTVQNIVESVQSQVGATVDTKSVILDTPIRDTGSHTVMFKLHEKVEVPVVVNVTAA